MSYLQTIIQGQSAATSMIFTASDTDSSPFAVDQPVSYKVLDPNGNFVLDGVASQNVSNPAVWETNITIPASAPITESGERYVLIWTAIGGNGKARREKTVSFEVVPAVDFNVLELNRMAREGTNLVDSISFPIGQTPTQIQVNLLSEAGDTIYASDVLTGSDIPDPIVSQGHNIYTFDSEDPIAGMTVQAAGYKPFVVEWVYTLNGVSNREYHFLYVVNVRTLMQVNTLRATIDKARFQNPNPALQYTDVDLIEYLNQGAMLINAQKPTMTNFGINNMPMVLSQSLNQAAAYCALSAQYLAEGASAFEFSGQAVSLTVDRTQSIDSALGRISADLLPTIATAKRLWLRSTGGDGSGLGVLGIVLGESLGMVAPNYRMEYWRRYVASIR